MMFSDTRICYRLQNVAVKVIHTASMHNILPEKIAQWCLHVLERLGIMTDTQAIDAVTFI